MKIKKNRIKKIRYIKNITRSELAKMTGISYNILLRIENHKSKLKPGYLWKIAKALNCYENYLLEEE